MKRFLVPRISVVFIIFAFFNCNFWETRGLCIPYGECKQCSKEDISSVVACSETGYVQKFSCTSSGTPVQGFSDTKQKDSTGLVQLELPEMKKQEMFKACIQEVTFDLSVTKVIRFELLMLGVATYSLFYVRRRKRAAYHRLTSIVNA